MLTTVTALVGLVVLAGCWTGRRLGKQQRRALLKEEARTYAENHRDRS